MTETLYDVLGARPDATQKEIGALWRRLALLHHPDKGGDLEKFKAVRKAYEVLKNPSKRRIYDRFGLAGVDIGSVSKKFASKTSNVPGASPFNLFNLFRNQRSYGKSLPKGPEVTMHLKIDLADLYKGMTKCIKMKRQIPCVICKGSGCRVQSHDAECLTCDGVGMQIMHERSISRPEESPIVEKKQVQCPTCDGLGIMVPHDNKCIGCCGRRMQPEIVPVVIVIPPGSRNNDRIVVEAVGDQIPGHSAADLVVVIVELPDVRFRRINDDLAVSVPIALIDALTGVSFYFKHLDHRLMHVKHGSKEILSQGSFLVVTGEGFPNTKIPAQRGHLYIDIEIEFPKDGAFNCKHEEIMRQIFPRLSKAKQYIRNPREYAIEVKATRMKRTKNA